jgi:hypothetical protein
VSYPWDRIALALAALIVGGGLTLAVRWRNPESRAGLLIAGWSAAVALLLLVFGP